MESAPDPANPELPRGRHGSPTGWPQPPIGHTVLHHHMTLITGNALVRCSLLKVLKSRASGSVVDSTLSRSSTSPLCPEPSPAKINILNIPPSQGLWERHLPQPRLPTNSAFTLVLEPFINVGMRISLCSHGLAVAVQHAGTMCWHHVELARKKWYFFLQTCN